MQYVAFNLGDEVLCMSKPSAPEASQTPQDIYEMRLDRVIPLQHKPCSVSSLHLLIRWHRRGQGRSKGGIVPAANLLSAGLSSFVNCAGQKRCC